MRKLILRSDLSPGDIVTMTAAVRDLHAAHPGLFLTDVRTPCPALWEHNPHVTPIPDGQGQEMRLEYPLIHKSNQLPVHFISGYRADLGNKLRLAIPPGPFRGDIHLSEQERNWIPQVEGPFWIIVSGGKTDFTAKWWDPERWQAVVDHFAGKLRFVQVGEAGHKHPALRGVIDLRGKTDLRQLVRLVYHSSGVLCPVTSLMHLAAAVPTKSGNLRPCVVVAGGREPSQWEAYPGHRYLDTIGALPCCSSGGCWKSRVVPLGDGDKKDESLCVHPVQSGGVIIPRCLDLITAADVIRAVESYAPEPKPIADMGCCGKTIDNALGAVARIAKAVVNGEPVRVSKEEQAARLKVCVACDEYEPPTKLTGPRCRNCTCFVKLKSRYATEFCPLGKWSGDPSSPLGVVIGTYAAVPYIHLQLEARRRFHPSVPYLVVDDGSPDGERLAALCNEYGADFISNSPRVGHVAGDMLVFTQGHEWALRRGLHYLVKFSRRWIPLRAWVPETLQLFRESQAATLCGRCEYHGFGFRSESVAMDVRMWEAGDAHLPTREAIDRGRSLDPTVPASSQPFILVENIIHQAAHRAAKAAPLSWHDLQRASAPKEGCDGYTPWPMMENNRVRPHAEMLWHEWARPEVYLKALEAWGITAYTLSDMVDASANIH